jgi:hypothetical protein
MQYAWTPVAPGIPDRGTESRMISSASMVATFIAVGLLKNAPNDDQFDLVKSPRTERFPEGDMDAVLRADG